MSKPVIALIIFGVIAFIVVIAGCSMFPSNTSISMTSDVGEIDEASIKLQQDFKWRK